MSYMSYDAGEEIDQLREEIERLQSILRTVVSAVRALGTIEDGKTLFEASPSKSQAAFDAWLALNEAIAKANHVLAEGRSDE